MYNRLDNLYILWIQFMKNMGIASIELFFCDFSMTTVWKSRRSLKGASVDKFLDLARRVRTALGDGGGPASFARLSRAQRTEEMSKGDLEEGVKRVTGVDAVELLTNWMGMRGDEIQNRHLQLLLHFAILMANEEGQNFVRQDQHEDAAAHLVQNEGREVGV